MSPVSSCARIESNLSRPNLPLGGGDGGNNGCCLFEVTTSDAGLVGDGLGDEGGVVVDEALSVTYRDGLELEENIMPGALLASFGGRDQITQSGSGTIISSVFSRSESQLA